MKLIRVTLLLIFLLILEYNSAAQQAPLHPISNRVFSPSVFNPAIAGSKDFMALDLAATIQGEGLSQLLSGNARIARKGPQYLGAPVAKRYTNYGVGAAIFNDTYGTSRNVGASVAASYHMPLDEKNLSFFSVGIALKGIYNMSDSVPEFNAPRKNSFIPGIDAGVYFYGRHLYAGISATNILGNMIDSADMATYNIPVSRQYFFLAGYKLVLSKPMNIVIEPSLIVNLNDSLDFDKKETYNPMLKLYMEAFCIGAYLHNHNNLTFFFQYKFPQLYIGALVDFPREVPFYKRDLTIEIAAGINIGSTGTSSRNRYQW
jgi:type IX secretion system PorP/SprF family membrane protein